MSLPLPASSSLSQRNLTIARTALQSCNYREDLIREDITLPDLRNGVLAFAHRPFDARSACIAILPSTEAPQSDIIACRETGVSLFFIAGETKWDAWTQTSTEPKHLYSLPVNQVQNFFRGHKEEFEPHTVFRAKTWLRAGIGRQLDFVDTGLLPMLEREAGGRLLDVFERMIAVSMNSLGWDAVPHDDADAHWLTKANFWLLAAKLFHDKRVSRFINLDFSDVRTIFDRVAFHYNRANPNPPKINGRLRALEASAQIAQAAPHFRNISAEALGMLYEEALINPTTRKLLGTHRTPTYLVDYMLARLSGWITELGYKRCYVFEPACGHAPFLCSALRLLSDMLPASIADNPKLRHDYLREHLQGLDNDPFALEISRLCLTLADIPNENGWVLQKEDMFAGTILSDATRKASLVFANPPFEKEQASIFLKRTVAALKPGSIFGFVLPINELTGNPSESVRRQLLKDCEIKEISVFPDSMFKFASVESAIILGRKTDSIGSTLNRHILFRRIRKSRINDFRDRYLSSWEAKVDSEWLKSINQGRLVVPELRKLWESCKNYPKLKDTANVGKGFEHRSTNDPKFPRGAITESNVKIQGLVEGFASAEDAPFTHQTPAIIWLNLDPKTVRRSLAGTVAGTPQVLLNYAPAGPGDAWRLKAFIDRIGRPATSDFLVIRSESLSVECLWALCNSPVANAYSLAFGTKRHTTAGVLRELPVPAFSQSDMLTLEAAVRRYFDAATEFTIKSQPKATKRRFIVTVKRKLSGAVDQMKLSLVDEPNESEIASAREHLRALHWRVDAEVLKLYALDPKIERELLDEFDGVRRIGVPFEQTRYIPREFREALTLDEFLRITDEWDATEARRCELINKRIIGGGRTETEEREFRDLQRLLTLRRQLYSPLPTKEIRAITTRIKNQAKWETHD